MPGWSTPSGSGSWRWCSAYAAAYLVGLIAAAAILRRRLGRIDGHRLLRTHARVAVAAGIAGIRAG